MKSGFYNFAGCFVLNPSTDQPTPHLMCFSMDADGGKIYPHPIIEGPYRNCSKLPEGEPIDIGQEMGAAWKVQQGYPGAVVEWNALMERKKLK